MSSRAEGLGHETEGRRPFLAHHFDDPRQQYESAKTGMWLFLATEVLLFSGLFCAYAVYRANHPQIFEYAHRFLDKSLGATNTLILILSSLTAAWAVRAAQLNQRKRLIGMIAVTLFCACCFLGIKAVEYDQKWKHGLLWGQRFHPVEHASGGHHDLPGTEPTAPAGAVQSPPAVASDPMNLRSVIPSAAAGPAGLAGSGGPGLEAGSGREGTGREAAPPERPRNVQIFFGIYFAMTGLHAIHVLAGMSAFIWVLRRAIRGDFSSAYFTPVELTALYWHLVDLIWIYLFPLLYLIR